MVYTERVLCSENEIILFPFFAYRFTRTVYVNADIKIPVWKTAAATRTMNSIFVRYCHSPPCNYAIEYKNEDAAHDKCGSVS